MEERLPLSVVVATTRPWPEVRATLDSLWGQTRAAGGEILVVDGHGQGVPDDLTTHYPGITEDHCLVCPDWCRQMLETHLSFPDAAAVGGAVDNGSTESLIDWANYFVAHSPMMAPIPGGRARTISAQAGMALKRRVVPKEIPSHGIMEGLFLDELHRRGEVLIANDQIVVHHVQSHGFWNTFAVHFHNGRSIGGFRKQTMNPWHVPLRLAWCLALPGILLLRPIVVVMRKGRFRRQLAWSLPLIMALACCHSAGEFVGYLAGAGNSPEKLS
jgi:hypothetical protein